ncbi:hypothetical protein B0H65DRAFT_281625 [Neurospora tetraspora]|uniref:Ubiquitin-like domain-containing protein n=1 Tax=Neurospora tetraspora TaxID=94610 RepID=A0AAE0J7Z7_9PEZI|nr:hypothetical protein B0H65DRAFT_281625 [Neurospora tetraspora]
MIKRREEERRTSRALAAKDTRDPLRDTAKYQTETVGGDPMWPTAEILGRAATGSSDESDDRHSAPERTTQSGTAVVPGISRYEERKDDFVHLVYKNAVYPEDFPAYSIRDGKLLFSDVKERVAMNSEISDRHGRIRLHYKGRRLRDDDKLVEEYGVKHNSKITVTTSEWESESSRHEDVTIRAMKEDEIIGVDGITQEEEEPSSAPTGPKRQLPESAKYSDQFQALGTPDA